jgi:TetR/AcrR family transcriptional regulator
MKKDQNTEEKILQAAEEIFQQKGFDGARMQEIADHASINKGLLHYYFKTKHKLFEAIFKKSFNRIMFSIEGVLETEAPLFDKLELFVDEYISLLLRNPALPRFVFNEINTNADAFIKVYFKDKGTRNISALVGAVQKEIEEKRIKPIDPRQFLMNLMAMCVFPFLARPILQVVMKLDNQQFMQLMQERKKHIVQFMRDALTP